MPQQGAQRISTRLLNRVPMLWKGCILATKGPQPESEAAGTYGVESESESERKQHAVGV